MEHHRSGKLDSTKTKIAYFLDEYYSRLQASYCTFAKWMKGPFKFLRPSELNMLTHQENKAAKEFLKQSRTGKTLQSAAAVRSTNAGVGPQTPVDYKSVAHKVKTPSIYNYWENVHRIGGVHKFPTATRSHPVSLKTTNYEFE